VNVIIFFLYSSAVNFDLLLALGLRERAYTFAKVCISKEEFVNLLPLAVASNKQRGSLFWAD